ncbi:MAG: cob(I)yrinic acid a,c-diamide adenosyltransferase [Burkholderiaceae bacterium]
MGKRLSAISTRTGDDGSTGLGDGSRISKTSLRVQAMGDVDELNSMIGLLLTEPMPAEIEADLVEIQHDLFDLGGELSIPGFENIHPPQLARLDARLAHYNANLPRLEEFILPGGARPSAIAHLCRTICRRAERSVVALGADEGDTGVRPLPRQYLNRLSDLMFVLARVLNRAAGRGDVQWRPRRHADGADGSSAD